MAQHSYPTPSSDLLESALKSGGRFPGAGAPLQALIAGPRIREEQAMQKRIFEERRQATKQKSRLEAEISRARLTEFDRKEKDAKTTAKNKEAWLKHIQELEESGALPKGTVKRIIERTPQGGSVKTTQGSTLAEQIQQLIGQGAPGQRGPGQGQPGQPQIPGQAPRGAGIPGQGQPTGQRSVGAINVGPSGISVKLVESLPEELQALGVKVSTGDATPGELQEILGQLKNKQDAFKWIDVFQRAKATKEATAGRTQIRRMQALKTAFGMIQQLTAQVDKLGLTSIGESTIIILNRILKDAGVPAVDATKPGWFEKLQFEFGLGGGPAVQSRAPGGAPGLTNKPKAGPRRSPELQRFMETQGR